MISSMLVIFASLLGIDVLIKQQVEENIEPGEEKELAGGRIVIRKVYNRGFLMNILDGKPKVVRYATIVSGIGLLIWDILTFLPVRIIRTARVDGKAGGIRLGIRRGPYLRLLSAGAASNIFDRLVRGRVIDYIGIRTGERHLDRITANLGDCFIACGGLILMLRDLVCQLIIIPGRRTP